MLFRQPFSISWLEQALFLNVARLTYRNICCLRKRLLFIFLDNAIFNKDIFRGVWRDYLPCHYIAVAFYFTERLYGFWGKSSRFTSGILWHPGKVIGHGTDKGVCDHVDIWTVFHSGQFVFLDVIIKIPR